jgi:hypothetical protein
MLIMVLIFWYIIAKNNNDIDFVYIYALPTNY